MTQALVTRLENSCETSTEEDGWSIEEDDGCVESAADAMPRSIVVSGGQLQPDPGKHHHVPGADGQEVLLSGCARLPRDLEGEQQPHQAGDEHQ